MSRVLIVGAGLTGSLCACLLRREMRHNVEIVVWDKARGAGGRMHTSRGPSEASCTVDLGAQYITATQHYASTHHSFYEELLAHGVLTPLTSSIEGMMTSEEAGHRNYVTPGGVASIVKHFLEESEAEVFFERHVTHLYRRGVAWEVVARGVARAEFDAVVLTMPVPQILQLQGDLGACVSEAQREQLGGVVYSSRFALGLFFPPQLRPAPPWSATYVSTNPCIRYIALDDMKRNAESSDRGSSMVVHTSVPFGLRHLDDDTEVESIILQELNKLLPGLPRPISSKLHKWRYSQVLTSVPGCPGQMTLLQRPLLVCGGDAFTHSNFDGCVASALKVVNVLSSAL